MFKFIKGVIHIVVFKLLNTKYGKMNWFIVVYFLVNSTWIEADQLGKEGWSPITQPNYNICIKKVNESKFNFVCENQSLLLANSVILPS